MECHQFNWNIISVIIARYVPYSLKYTPMGDERRRGVGVFGELPYFAQKLAHLTCSLSSPASLVLLNITAHTTA